MPDTERPEALAARSGRVDIGLRNRDDSNPDNQRDQAWVIATIVKNSRESLRVSLDRYREHDYIDLRLYADNGVEQVPTRKGLTIRPDLLPAVIEALQQAENGRPQSGSAIMSSVDRIAVDAVTAPYDASAIKAPRHRATGGEMEERAELFIEYAQEHGPVTMRGMYYQAVRGISGIDQDEHGYAKVQQLVNGLGGGR